MLPDKFNPIEEANAVYKFSQRIEAATNRAVKRSSVVDERSIYTLVGVRLQAERDWFAEELRKIRSELRASSSTG